MNIGQLKALLAINRHALDEEISRQPLVFYEVADACVQAMADRDGAKEELDTIDAKLDGIVRKMLDGSKNRVTEAMVANGILLHPEHEKAYVAYMEAKTKADEVLALKEAFAQRGYMLRDMCQLYVTGYFEQNSVRGDSGAADRIQYNETRKKLAKARTGA